MTNILVPNLSAEAGRWMGILVSKVEPVVLDTVMTEFTIAAELHNSKVSFMVLSYPGAEFLKG
jgi:hypothetical protein